MMAGETLEELLRRRLEAIPPQLAPLAPPWINEVLPALISLGRKLDEVVKRLERIEKVLEELKASIRGGQSST